MKTLLFLLLFLCSHTLIIAQNDYDTQRGIELYNQKNYSAAIPYFQRAAKSGSLTALDYLGCMYANGQGIKQDAAIALNLLKKGVEKNYAPCIYDMGKMYEFGIGVKKDLTKAYSFYKQAADLNYAEAEYEVSIRKIGGIGTEENPVEAFQYAERAANHGSHYEHLGDLYYDGYGTKQSDAMALIWYGKADHHYSDRAKLRSAIIMAQGSNLSNPDPLQALPIIEELKKENSTIEGLDEWYQKIRIAAKEQEVRENAITVPLFTEKVHQYIRNYPEPHKPAIESAGRGEIVIACTVTASGRISNARIKYRVLERLDKAALDLIKNMPPLTPGTKGGKNGDLNIEIGVSFFPTRVKISKCYR